MVNLSQCKNKLQLIVTFYCFYFTSCCISGSVGTEVTVGALQSHRHQKIPLPPSTSSVKCHCQPVGPENDDTENTQKDIEIQIFKSEKDKQLSSAENSKATQADRRKDASSQPDDDRTTNMQFIPDQLKSNRQGQQSSFKAYKSVDLFGGDRFPSHSTGKIMHLGIMPGAFIGPRRRKRRAALQADRNVVYVYPVNYYGHSDHPNNNNNIEAQAKLDTSEQPEPLIFEYKPSIMSIVPPNNNQFIQTSDQLKSAQTFAKRNIDVSEKDAQLNKAMKNAWEEYGIKSPMRKEISANPTDHIQIVNPNPFQETGSEWDYKMAKTPVPIQNQGVTPPGFFSPVLEKYINFEVNNHEVADFGRKIIFGIFVGTLIIGWILIGVSFGFIPTYWSIFEGKSNSDGKRNSGDKLSEITDRIMLALDSGWLKKLEERVKKDPRGDFIRTHAHCCILPNSRTDGMVDCQLVRRKSRASSTFKCLSDLIYNIEFGENKADSFSNKNSTLVDSDDLDQVLV